MAPVLALAGQLEQLEGSDSVVMYAVPGWTTADGGRSRSTQADRCAALPTATPANPASIVVAMSELMTADRRATADEVAAKRVELRTLASRHRFTAVEIAADGMIIVRTEAPGYRDLARFAGEASRLVGAYVQVVTDDVPAASVPTIPL